MGVNATQLANRKHLLRGDAKERGATKHMNGMVVD